MGHIECIQDLFEGAEDVLLLRNKKCDELRELAELALSIFIMIIFGIY